MSTSAIGVCLAEQIPVVFMSQAGDYKGHLWSSEFCDLPTEAAQFGRQHDPGFQLEMARQIVWGKGMNSRISVQRLNRKRKVAGMGGKLKRLEQHLTAGEQARDLNELWGYERAMAKLYFGALGQMITNPGFSLTGRSRRPPKDPVNSLLSFGYTLLANNVLSLISHSTRFVSQAGCQRLMKRWCMLPWFASWSDAWLNRYFSDVLLGDILIRPV